MIELRNFTKVYGKYTAVNNISFTVPRGSVFGLLGPNGAGKSTTVKAITGAIRCTSGQILIDGVDLSRNPELCKRKIGYVPENPELFKNLTGKEYMDLTGRLYHLTGDVLKNRMKDLLEKFDLAGKANEQILSYSKGMVQKLLIASALLPNPEILILDEPLSGLDAGSAAVFKETVKSFASRGKTILFSSHILEVIEKLCDRITILNEGRILSEGDSSSIVAATGTSSLEEAFIKLTGRSDVKRDAEEILSALD